MTVYNQDKVAAARLYPNEREKEKLKKIQSITDKYFEIKWKQLFYPISFIVLDSSPRSPCVKPLKKISQ